MSYNKYLDLLDYDKQGVKIKKFIDKWKACPYEFDAEKVEKLIAWCENNIRLETGKKFKMLKWHQIAISCVYGYELEPDVPLVTELVSVVATGNSKSILVVFFAWIELLIKKELNTHIGVMGKTKQKTNETIMAHMLSAELTKTMIGRKFVSKEIRKVKEGLYYDKKMSSMTVYANDAEGQDGGRESLVIVDEFAVFKKNPLQTLRNGLSKHGGRLIVITTNNTVRNGAFDAEIKGWEASLDDLEDFSKCVMLFMLDELMEYQDPDSWVKTNPAIDELPYLRRGIASAIKDATFDPQQLTVLMTKRFNWSLGDKTSYFTEEEAKMADKPFKHSGMWGVLSADFSLTDDLTAFCFTYQLGGKRYVETLALCPQANYKEEYPFITYHNGVKNDSIEAMVEVRNWLDSMDAHVFAFGYDKAYSVYAMQRLDDLGVFKNVSSDDIYQVNQNSFTLTPYISETKAMLKSHEIVHYSEQLERALKNARVKLKETTLLRLVKDNTTEKIDLADSLVNGTYVFTQMADYILQYEQENDLTIEEQTA